MLAFFPHQLSSSVYLMVSVHDNFSFVSKSLKSALIIGTTIAQHTQRDTALLLLWPIDALIPSTLAYHTLLTRRVTAFISAAVTVHK